MQISVDIGSMEDFELEQLRRNPKWKTVMEVYLQCGHVGRDQSKDFDGWMPRLAEVPEIPTTELPGIHGKLIAYGLLKFDLAGRDGGIRYQLTPLGKQGLSGASSDDESVESGSTVPAELAQA